MRERLAPGLDWSRRVGAGSSLRSFVHSMWGAGATVTRGLAMAAFLSDQVL